MAVQGSQDAYTIKMVLQGEPGPVQLAVRDAGGEPLWAALAQADLKIIKTGKQPSSNPKACPKLNEIPHAAACHLRMVAAAVLSASCSRPSSQVVSTSIRLHML